MKSINRGLGIKSYCSFHSEKFGPPEALLSKNKSLTLLGRYLLATIEDGDHRGQPPSTSEVVDVERCCHSPGSYDRHLSSLFLDVGAAPFHSGLFSVTTTVAIWLGSVTRVAAPVTANYRHLVVPPLSLANGVAPAISFEDEFG
ncbi:unnamed protein product [Lactuca saligna]|uniref:Uncharacterized protein n=1 Tax=Lactuca saligna TaxID=75948 RepID=A0AA35YTI9_LACSI|nr:unnamed protein product [Lactuca saligna]